MYFSHVVVLAKLFDGKKTLPPVLDHCDYMAGSSALHDSLEGFRVMGSLESLLRPCTGEIDVHITAVNNNHIALLVFCTLAM